MPSDLSSTSLTCRSLVVELHLLGATLVIATVTWVVLEAREGAA